MPLGDARNTNPSFYTGKYSSQPFTLYNTFTVGRDDHGHDVIFYGATSGKKFQWDESADTAILTCTVDIDGAVTVGVDDTGYDVVFYGATSGKKMTWDESADTLDIDGNLDVGADFIQTYATASTSTTIVNHGASAIGSSSAAKVYNLEAPVAGLMKVLWCVYGSSDLTSTVNSSTAVTFDGTNSNAVFNAAGDCLILMGASATRWNVLCNTGTVTFS